MPDESAVLEAVQDLAPASTHDIAAALGCSEQAAGHTLRKLYNDGQVISKRVGNTLVWVPASAPAEPVDWFA